MVGWPGVSQSSLHFKHISRRQSTLKIANPPFRSYTLAAQLNSSLADLRYASASSCSTSRRHSLVIGLACPCDRHHMTNLVLHHNRFGLRMLFEPRFPSRDPRLTWSNNVWHEMGLRRSWTCRSRQVR